MGHSQWVRPDRTFDSDETKAARLKWISVHYRVWPYPVARFQNWWFWRRLQKHVAADRARWKAES